MVVDSRIAMREYGKTLNDFATCIATRPRTQTTLRQLLLYFISLSVAILREFDSSSRCSPLRLQDSDTFARISLISGCVGILRRNVSRANVNRIGLIAAPIRIHFSLPFLYQGNLRGY